MAAVAVIVIVIAVIAVVTLAVGLLAAARRRRLRRRFGPEYDRLVTERGSRQSAEAELAGRERRVRSLDIHPLADAARARYAEQWAVIQERFVDAPVDAVASSQALVTALMRDRGYPTEDRDQIMADLSVGHAATLDHYRSATEISGHAASGAASTEDLRIAMIHYRALFRDLLGEVAESAGAGTQQPDAAGDPADGPQAQAAESLQPAPPVQPVRAEDPVPPVRAEGTVADRRANGSVDRMPRELSGPAAL